MNSAKALRASVVALGVVFGIISFLSLPSIARAAARPAIAPVTSLMRMSTKRAPAAKKAPRRRKMKGAGHKAKRSRKGKHHR